MVISIVILILLIFTFTNLLGVSSVIMCYHRYSIYAIFFLFNMFMKVYACFTTRVAFYLLNKQLCSNCRPLQFPYSLPIELFLSENILPFRFIFGVSSYKNNPPVSETYCLYSPILVLFSFYQ